MTNQLSSNAFGQVIVRLVDDDPVALRSVALLLTALGFRTVTYGSADAFLAECGDEPGCAVIDLQMPGTSGLEVQEALARTASRLPVVFLTGHADVRASVRAMKGGAVDFLIKPASSDELLAAVQRAIAIDAAARLERRQSQQLRARFQTLTPRERQVFSMVARGLLNREIASTLGTSERTVKAHRANVMRKMAVESLASLARLAERLRSDDDPVSSVRGGS